MNYPSLEYQNYLKEHETDSLQIIDENIYISDLIESNFKIVYFKYLDVWHKNQYCHAVLSKKVEFQRKENKHKQHLFKKILHNLEHGAAVTTTSAFFSTLCSISKMFRRFTEVSMSNPLKFCSWILTKYCGGYYNVTNVSGTFDRGRRWFCIL